MEAEARFQRGGSWRRPILASEHKLPLARNQQLEKDFQMASSPVPVHAPLGNRLLAALSLETYNCLYPHLEVVDLPLGTVLYEPGASLGYGYFPIRCIFSILNVLESGACSETAMVGNEGMLGVALFMGGGTSPDRAVVYNKGQAFRLASQLIKQEFNRNAEFRTLMLRYTQS